MSREERSETDTQLRLPQASGPADGILLSAGAPLRYVAQQSGHSARVMLASYARWQEQGAQAVTQLTATRRNRRSRPPR